ncbi:MAG: hypothetical protein R6V49_11365 [Bacteroidales bacterium]
MAEVLEATLWLRLREPQAPLSAVMRIPVAEVLEATGALRFSKPPECWGSRRHRHPKI